MKNPDRGLLAYVAYCKFASELQPDAKYLKWHELPPASRSAWTAVAEAADTRKKP